MSAVPPSHAPRARLAGTLATAYRAMWLTWCVALAAMGCMVLAIVSVPVLVTLFAGFAVVGGALAATRDGDRAGGSGPRRLHRAAIGGLVAGVAAPACVGLTVVLGDEVLVLVVLLGALSPAAMRVYSRGLSGLSPSPSMAHWAAGVAPPFPAFSPPQAPPALHLLSTEELCRAWCASYPILQDRTGRRFVRATLSTVKERQRYLDELERRNPAGLVAWLAAGATASSDPWPYLVRNRTGEQAIDWDELT